eukprot:1367-Heterococcus_DN1.PRE.1
MISLARTAITYPTSPSYEHNGDWHYLHLLNVRLHLKRHRRIKLPNHSLSHYALSRAAESCRLE